MEKNFSENNFAICFQFSLGIRGELTKYKKELSTLKKYETNYIRKGTKISRLFEPLDADFFCYQKSCEYMRDLNIKEKTYRNMSEEFPVEFDEFLNEILIHKTLLNKIIKKADCSIRVALQADESQIYFEFTPKQMSLLAEIGLRCEFSIISLGMVADI